METTSFPPTIRGSPDTPAMRFDISFCHRQSKARPARLKFICSRCMIGGIGTGIKLLEDPLQLFRFKSYAGILNGNLYNFRLAVNFHLYTALIGSELNGILN